MLGLTPPFFLIEGERSWSRSLSSSTLLERTSIWERHAINSFITGTERMEEERREERSALGRFSVSSQQDESGKRKTPCFSPHVWLTCLLQALSGYRAGFCKNNLSRGCGNVPVQEISRYVADWFACSFIHLDHLHVKLQTLHIANLLSQLRSRKSFNANVNQLGTTVLTCTGRSWQWNYY